MGEAWQRFPGLERTDRQEERRKEDARMGQCGEKKIMWAKRKDSNNGVKKAQRKNTSKYHRIMDGR